MSENILDLLRNKSVLSENAREKLLQLLPENSKEKLLGLFQRYEQLNEQEKQELLNKLFDRFKEAVQNRTYNNASLYKQLFYTHSYIIFFFALSFVVLVIVFFVYKLFKCLSEREMKREEKKKLKQMKKKK